MYVICRGATTGMARDLEHPLKICKGECPKSRYNQVDAPWSPRTGRMFIVMPKYLVRLRSL